MEQSRLFKIVYHLLEKGKSTAPELAEKFEVSIRTIYRDLDAISAAGIPIYTTQGKGGGIFIMQDFVLNKSILSEQEKEQILMALQGISITEHNQTDELLMKLGGLFQSKVTNWIEVDFSEWYKNTPNYDVFNLIKNAIFNQYIITFSYFAREGNYSNRTVEPIKLIFKNKDWYLYGFCLLRNDFRFFKLTRIKELKILSDTFKHEVKNIPEIETVIKHNNFIPAKLRFSPKAAFRVYDEFTDNISKDNQGNLYVNIDLPDNETLFSYILSFGDNVEILEPDYLRESMKEKLTLMLEKYIT
ncbi:helix-turn-helix transcriptional regulator [Clostridium porci]|uniref:YafY family transcriptional regulator n=1 Tax=Clostridium porci TaxID=2605778 RepID=A0A7X2NP92_9CLOT|nr:YafY family protein [Clostridium porci]MSS38535.1 YafY family transcriptional regulator [Clostridium porci]